MATYLQTERPMAVTNPVGEDALLLVGLAGSEALSHLFNFELDLLAENRTEVTFDKLLGQKVTVHLSLPDGKKRHFNGICSRVTQGERDDIFTAYRMEIVPQFWLLSKRAQSRIFQHVSVPDILKKVLEGVDAVFELQGSFQPRDFCVQYRETDFKFASRLMEEEGIYYFFKHSADGHKMVVANSPQSHPDLPGPTKIIHETVTGGTREEDRIYEWEKAQELRSGKCTLWDHSFEMPHQHLDADKTIQDSVQVGKVAHKLKVGGNDKLEIYDYPGEYAQRFDGIDRGGAERPAELQKIFEDNKRTVALRMQEEAVPSLVIQGASNCRHFVSGHKFTLDRHFSADGQYLLTGVRHTGKLSGDYRSNGSTQFGYQNTFTCMPLGLPYRPLRKTPKPTVQGSQTAVVVGPAGEEIFTDKYGRVKVQFHWDRHGKNDADSSCWCRVATLWAGKQWGVIHIPRIGQEVIVDFLEGDPDQPMIVGSVYNAEQMPPYKLPDNKTQSGIKSRSSLGGTSENFNEICFEDKKGEEFIYCRAEKDNIIAVENDETKWIGHDNWVEVDNDQTIAIGRDRQKTIDRNETTNVKRDRSEKVGRDEKISIGNDRTERVAKDESIIIGNNRMEVVNKDENISIKANRSETVGQNEEVSVGENRTHNVGKKDTLSVGK